MQLADTQRRGHRLQVENVADLRILKRFTAGHGDRNRSFLKRLLTLRRGDDDQVAGILIRRFDAYVVVLISILRKGNAWRG